MSRAPKIDKEAETALIRARTALYIDYPFYGMLALRLQMQEERSIPTLAVNHTTIFYNPEFVLGMPFAEQIAAMAHEVSHPMLDHIDRCGARNQKRWNAACDYVINAALKKDSEAETRKTGKMGMQIGKTWLYNPAYADMTADHIYTLLPEPDENGAGPGEGGGWGALDSMLPGNSAEAELRAVEWKIATIQTANICKKAGTLPGSMERFIEAVVGQKVDWREKLRRFRTQHTKNDYSWSRPQRRMLPWGYILPSLHSESLELMVNAIDTSGSVDDYTLNMFGSEIIAQQMLVRPLRTTNIYCDARINHVDTFEEHDHLSFKSYGRGGTDFRPPFKYVEDHNLKPACMVYLTDGEGPFPKTPPPYPVLWVMTTSAVPPWGDYVRIDT
jgi:predicted metal-dependent peptidase